jgi:hypothetical protein
MLGDISVTTNMVN